MLRLERRNSLSRVLSEVITMDNARTCYKDVNKMVMQSYHCSIVSSENAEQNN